jgi:RNA polymerase sigma-70 factor (ECF subfamily)
MSANSDFEAFYAGNVRRLTAVVYAATGDICEAEDAVHEAFARAWERWDDLSSEGDPVGWVRTVALRLSISNWRKARNRLRAYFRHGAPAHARSPAPDRVALLDAMRRLSPAQRHAVVLYHLLDLPIETIARETGTTPGAVRTRLSRARGILASRLAVAEQPAQDGSASGDRAVT